MMHVVSDFGESWTPILFLSLSCNYEWVWCGHQRTTCLTCQKSLLPSRAIPVGVTFHLNDFLYLTNCCRSCIVLCLNNSDTASVLLGIFSQFEKKSIICISQSAGSIVAETEESIGVDGSGPTWWVGSLFCQRLYLLWQMTWDKEFWKSPVQKIWQMTCTKSPSFSANLFCGCELPKS